MVNDKSMYRPHAWKLMDQIHEELRYHYYSKRTEEADSRLWPSAGIQSLDTNTVKGWGPWTARITKNQDRCLDGCKPPEG